jgi:hypothetical protein
VSATVAMASVVAEAAIGVSGGFIFYLA